MVNITRTEQLTVDKPPSRSDHAVRHSGQQTQVHGDTEYAKYHGSNLGGHH